MEEFTSKMARESVAMGFLLRGSTDETLLEVCKVLQIPLGDEPHDRLKLLNLVLDNFAEGWS